MLPFFWLFDHVGEPDRAAASEHPAPLGCLLAFARQVHRQALQGNGAISGELLCCGPHREVTLALRSSVVTFRSQAQLPRVTLGSTYTHIQFPPAGMEMTMTHRTSCTTMDLHNMDYYLCDQRYLCDQSVQLHQLHQCDIMEEDDLWVLR